VSVTRVMSLGWVFAADAPPSSSEPARDVSSRVALVALIGLVLASLAVRLWLLQTAVADGALATSDPDGYMNHGRQLAQGGQGWHWTLDAIKYKWESRTYLLPPLYPVFLSLFAVASTSFPYSAVVGQIVLNALSVAAIFSIANTLHSRRAGLIAAFVYAFWIPNIWTFALFMQEQLYLPLLLVAFALLVRASAEGKLWTFVFAGVAFGFAALTRSMPVYYMMVAAVGYVAMAKQDSFAVRRASALLAGFLLVTGGYSIWLSSQTDQFVFIENHGGISLHYYGGGRVGPLGPVQIIERLIATFFEDPIRFMTIFWGYVLALFHVHGDRWLHSMHAATASGAAFLKFVAHAGIDLPFVASVALAPLGAAFAKRSREAALLVVWIVLVIVLSAIGAFGGVRYRAPIEPHLIVLASVVVAGAWRRPSRAGLVTALVIAIGAGSVLAMQLPRVASARANYGVDEWNVMEQGHSNQISGDVGLNVLPTKGLLQFRVYALEPVSPERPIKISLRIDGRAVDERVIVSAEPLEMRFLARDAGFEYVELHATNASGQPAQLRVDIGR
jgi:4-amino-4-deoxy-L-arabinose transferase-like glycosyltransferase